MILLENLFKRLGNFKYMQFGKGKESDPTDASVDKSANASVDTPPTRRPTHYRHVGRHSSVANYSPTLPVYNYANSVWINSLTINAYLALGLEACHFPTIP